MVNGFYPAMAEQFSSEELAPRGLHWRVLEWEASALTWADFRENGE